MTDRRQFLKRSALVSLTPLVPAFLPRTVCAESGDVEGRIFVVYNKFEHLYGQRANPAIRYGDFMGAIVPVK